ncbi:hypothetical protein AB9R79_12780, partial [Vibrio splendidus]
LWTRFSTKNRISTTAIHSNEFYHTYTKIKVFSETNRSELKHLEADISKKSVNQAGIEPR